MDRKISGIVADGDADGFYSAVIALRAIKSNISRGINIENVKLFFRGDENPKKLKGLEKILFLDTPMHRIPKEFGSVIEGKEVYVIDHHPVKGESLYTGTVMICPTAAEVVATHFYGRDIGEIIGKNVAKIADCPWMAKRINELIIGIAINYAIMMLSPTEKRKIIYKAVNQAQTLVEAISTATRMIKETKWYMRGLKLAWGLYDIAKDLIKEIDNTPCVELTSNIKQKLKELADNFLYEHKDKGNRDKQETLGFYVTQWLADILMFYAKERWGMILIKLKEGKYTGRAELPIGVSLECFVEGVGGKFVGTPYSFIIKKVEDKRIQEYINNFAQKILVI